MRENILKPLQKIFYAISDPSTNSFAWAGVKQAEIIFLNDFRWCENFLKIFEWDTVHIAATKTHFSKDIVMDKDSPFFATSISRIQSYSNGRINELETAMMEVRMKTFSFYNQFQ